MLHDFYRSLGLRHIELVVNSIGTAPPAKPVPPFPTTVPLLTVGSGSLNDALNASAASRGSVHGDRSTPR